MKHVTSVIAAALLLVACDEGPPPARDVTATPGPPTATATAEAPASTPGGSTTPGTTTPGSTAPGSPGAPGGSPATPATAIPAPTSTPAASPPPDGVAASPPLPPRPVPTATPHVRVPSATPPPLDPSRNRVAAPIEQLDVRIAESAPPQVFVDVTTGLPGGCAAFDSVTLVRSGSTLTLTMWNTMPASDAVACTAIYGYVRHTVPLGAIEPGTYTLRVNDQTRIFSLK